MELRENYHSGQTVISYEQTGLSTNTNELGMREMQARVYEKRNEQYLLVKAPPASGKSRAMMFVALDKLAHQGIKKVIVAVPEKSIGRSFNDTSLKKYGFFEDWSLPKYFNLCDTGNEQEKVKRFKEFVAPFTKAKTLVCTHATLRFAPPYQKPTMKEPDVMPTQPKVDYIGKPTTKSNVLINSDIELNKSLTPYYPLLTKGL